MDWWAEPDKKLIMPYSDSSTSECTLHKSSFVSFDGKSLALLHGNFDAERETAILILPFGLRVAAAEQLCATLARNLNIITWQGRSLSDDPLDENEDPLTPESHIRDLDALLRWSGEKRCHVIGFCSGAGIAILAASELDDRIEKLVLVCGEYMLDEALCPQSSFQREVDRLLPLAAQNPGIAEMLSDKLAAGRDESERRARQTEFDTMLAEPFTSGKHLYRHGVNYNSYKKMDFISLATEVSHPVLLISTQDDQQVFPEASHLIAKECPTTYDYQVFPGDHYEILRGKKALTSAVIEFVTQKNKTEIRTNNHIRL